nr:ras guanine nucleotide exchange factor a [Quercus suber]
MSWIEKGKKPQGTLASAQLAKVHDLCISHIGALIGHHLHSRATSELVETTTGLVNACKSMLAIVDEVYSHDTKKSTTIQQARHDLQMRLEELIGSTKHLFHAASADEDQVVVLPEQSDVLVAVGTELIRTAGDCVVKTRSVIEQIGDFALEDTQATSPDTAEDSETPENVVVEKRLSKRLSMVDSARENRISLKMFPPPPPLKARPSVTLETSNLFAPSPTIMSDIITPNTPFSATSNKSLPLIPQRQSTLKISQIRPLSSEGRDQPQSTQTATTVSARKNSVGISIAGSTDTINSSARDSATTAISEVSTRATTPDQSKEVQFTDSALLSSFASLSSLQSGVAEVDADAESQLLQRTYASELILNKDGQVTGGSLPALVEQLTTHDAAPDPLFVSAFYVTFRTFTTPRNFAEALSARFDYIGDSKTVGTPVRLRIYNVFKGWLETYWNGIADKEALEDIRSFALQKLKPHLSSAGDRLIELTKKVDTAYQSGTFSSQLVSGVGKSSMSIASTHTDGSNVPAPAITQKQLSLLRTSANATSPCSILDFEPLELARQLTLLVSQIFCAIQPEELLEWNKKGSQKRNNVRAICSLNTDVAHVVGDSILGPEDAKRRAMLIKHWAKIATCCLELNNYETLMAIMCSLNSSVLQRLKRTWELVSKKTKLRLDELNTVVDHSKNHASMRRRLETPIAPCLPFLGIYLTDLTFIDAGNPKTRELPGSAASETGEIVTVINFDRHMRTAKVLSHLQKFQVAYKLESVPELQKWLESHLERMRNSEGELVTKFHRRSLVVEPKMECSAYRVQRASSSSRSSSKAGSEDVDRPRTNSVPSIDEGIKDKFAFLRNNTFGFKTHAASHDVHTLDVVPEQEK